jgi:hypothetical protein
MKALKCSLLGLIAGVMVACSTSSLQAYGGYYSGYNYYPSRGYYYSHYYYKPYQSYPSYNHHYAVYYPQYPKYVYYYNPYKQSYWGRYDLESKGYSLLAEKDRKAKLSDIPESAFPKPGAMPADPDSNDGSTIPVPPAPPAAAQQGQQGANR